MKMFPSATKTEIEETRRILKHYVRIRQTTKALQEKEALTEKEHQVLTDYKKKADAVEMAINLIQDEGVKKVMDFRFIRGNSRWGTVKRFESITDRSVDRRIVRGVESVAEILKLIEII